MYASLCSYDNLELAFRRARKRKTLKGYVIEFESDLENNLKKLKNELEIFTYVPRKLTTFIVRDPKTRKISASHFRDRVVHHALCNIIAPIFEKGFIYDSFANQKGKGTHIAIKRFERFLGKVCYVKRRRAESRERERESNGRSLTGFALKADIRHYFDNVDHAVLMNIIRRRIKDNDVLWLIKTILKNHKIEIAGKGMPIGNLTSQFFANVYLNELDQFVKHKLKVGYYLRYVDDFIILHRDRRTIENWKEEIDRFLKSNLKIELHPEKSMVVSLENGITLLGFRVFRNYRLLKKSNARRIWRRMERLKQKYDRCEITFEDAQKSFDGWIAYAEFGNTYKLRKRVNERFDSLFKREIVM